jgi:hypothetical protein
LQGGTAEFAIRTIPLQSDLTEMRLSLSENSKPLHPTIVLELPILEKDYSLELPISAEPQRDTVKRYYNNAASFNEAEWFVGYVRAEEYLTYLQGSVAVDETPLTEPLGRALVVYAEAVDFLIQKTEWFGRPASLGDRTRMLQRLIQEGTPALLTPLRESRLKGALASVQGARSHIIGRAYASILENTDCRLRFPLARALYTRMVRMPAAEYDLVKDKAKVTRTDALLAATGCFNELWHLNDPSVFGVNETPSQAASTLRKQLQRELSKTLAEAGVEEGDAPCEEVANLRRKAKRLCGDIKYFEDLEAASSALAASAPG